MKRALTLALLLTVGAAAEARALTVTTDPVVQTDLAIAQTFWNATPKCAEVVEVAPLSQINARAGAMAESDEPGCLIKINPTYWPTYEARLHTIGQYRWTPSLAMSCAVLVHEYGHSLGYGHSSDPANVMYQTPLTTSVPACIEAWKPTEDTLTAQIQREMTVELEAEARIEVAPAVHRKHRHHKRHHRTNV